MASRLYLASSNRGKLRELGALAEPEGFELVLLSDYDRLPPHPEDHASFALNALDKALYYSQASDGLVVADDSGLVVDALGGRPGVRSARYAGPSATDEDNNRKLLEELRGVPEEKRSARFVCVLALAREGRALALFSDFYEGRILEAPRGRGGFGYDPLFLIPSLGRTGAELSPQEKNRWSHRGKACAKLLAYLRQQSSARG
ncbi:MAG: RdgB/HAM1 family non-canonical purine NTP pyrophosphatase [Candidatus Acidiferrales bacterium]